MKCPRSYYWRVMQGVDLAVPSQAIINGKAYHEAKHTYHNCKLAGMSHEISMAKGILALKPVMAEILDPKPEYTLTVAVDTMMNYFTLWKDEHYKTLQVEVGFAVDLVNFFFVGKIDRFMEAPFGRLIEETKSTSIVGKRWNERGKPNLQVDGYYAGAYISTGELPWGACLDIIPVHKDGSKRQKPFRILTVRNKQDVEDWITDVQEWWITLERYKNDNVYPRNTETCVPLLGYSCSFKDLCARYPHPHRVSEIELPGDYTRREWAPYEALLNEEDVDGKGKS